MGGGGEGRGAGHMCGCRESAVGIGGGGFTENGR